MKFLLSVTLLASTLLSNVNAARWKPKPGLTWDYLLGGNKNTIQESDKDVVTFDLEYAEKMVPILHSKGQKAVCYFSGGDGWGNKWLDVKQKSKLQPLIRKRFQRAYKYGCDAVEVDCLGIHRYHPEKFTKDDTFTFGKWVAETAHEENISVGLKNVATISEKLEPYFDFAVVESCADDHNLCEHYTKFTKNNKAVFIVHYEDEGYKLSGSKLKTLIKEQSNRGFTCVMSVLNLKSHSTNYDCNTGSII
ncbi:glycoside hydrolase family 114 protein, partial [Piromyces sp. E2]